ncbi:hypothetical protein [Phocaeicola plebeius]|nr:hypothetical protein [Phocaeicola plebeius]
MKTSKNTSLTHVTSTEAAWHHHDRRSNEVTSEEKRLKNCASKKTTRF